MNICEMAEKMIYDELSMFKRYVNVEDMNSQYHYMLGMIESLYNINIVDRKEYKELKRELKYKYDYHKDRIGELEEGNANEK